MRRSGLPHHQLQAFYYAWGAPSDLPNGKWTQAAHGVAATLLTIPVWGWAAYHHRSDVTALAILSMIAVLILGWLMWLPAQKQDPFPWSLRGCIPAAILSTGFGVLVAPDYLPNGVGVFLVAWWMISIIGVATALAFAATDRLFPLGAVIVGAVISWIIGWHIGDALIGDHAVAPLIIEIIGAWFASVVVSLIIVSLWIGITDALGVWLYHRTHPKVVPPAPEPTRGEAMKQGSLALGILWGAIGVLTFILTRSAADEQPDMPAKDPTS